MSAQYMFPVGLHTTKIYTDPKMALSPTDWTSLYIPNIVTGLHVSPAKQKWDLANIFNMDLEKRKAFRSENLQSYIENTLCLGKVRRIDFVEKASVTGIETSAFVHFEWWCYNTSALQLRRALDTRGNYRRHTYYVSTNGTNDHVQCFGFHTMNPPTPRFLAFMINLKPIPDSDTNLNVHQLASINASLETQVTDAEKRAQDAEKRVQELEAQLHDIELRTKIVHFRESEVEKNKQKLEDEFNKKGDELYKQQKALYKESDELYARETALDARHIALNRRHIALNRRDVVLDGRDTALDRRDTELDSRDTALDARDTALDARETALDFREDALNVRETELDSREDDFAERTKPSFLEESAFKTAAAKLGPQFVYDTLYSMEPPPAYTMNDPVRIKREGESYWFPDYYKKIEYSHVMSLIKGNTESGDFWTKMMSSDVERVGSIMTADELSVDN